MIAVVTSFMPLQVALYCSKGDEDALLEYLQSARDILNRPLYDPQAALRLARQHNLARASVELLWQLGLYQVPPNPTPHPPLPNI